MMGPVHSVVHVLAPAAYGGLETVVRSLVRAQRARGVQAEVVAVVDGWESRFVEEAKADGIDCRVVTGSGRAYWREIAAVGRSLEESGPSPIVHTHGYRPDVLAGIAARRRGLRRVSTVHGFTGGDRKNRLYEWLQVRSLRGFDRVVAVSDSVARRLERGGVASARIATVQNGFAPRSAPLSRAAARATLGVSDQPTVIGWVGRLGPEKSPETLVRAVARLGGDVLVVVIGDGPERARLLELAEQLGVATRIRWAGAVSEAGRLFAAFDCYVLSSLTEGTPMVLFEAAGAGVPIVTTAVGGVPDVVSEREAWLVEPGQPEQLAAAIAAALEPGGAGPARVANAARRLADQFGADRWVERYNAVYREVSQ